MALGIGVDVTWSGNHHRAILWNDRPASSSDIPVLVIDGQEYGTTNLMPDTRIMAKCLRPGLGPCGLSFRRPSPRVTPSKLSSLGDIVQAHYGRGRDGPSSFWGIPEPDIRPLRPSGA
jgi:hypothetical protein